MWLASVLALGSLATGVIPPVGDTVRFVVLGHLRGPAIGLNPRLAETLARARGLRPDFAVLTGDLIWGKVDQPTADASVVERQWNEIDSAIATLGVPVFRVPGNHDIQDLVTRDLWWRRYGPLPAVAKVGGLRLLLLSSAWIPPDGDQRLNPFVRGIDLDSAQVSWLASELRVPSRGPTFAFMHHLLWWEPDGGRWWREVHPLLAGAGVTAVFSGDYGPLKYSTLERDGVRYFQTSIEVPVSLPMLRNRLSSRLLSAQFDNFLEVIVSPAGTDVRVHPVAEVTSGEFTPQRYRDINEAPAKPTASMATRIWDLIGSPLRLTMLAVASAALVGAGYLVGRRRAG